MGFLNKLRVHTVNNTTTSLLIEPTLWAVSQTAADVPDKVIPLDNDFKLVTGVQIAVRFTNTNTADNPRLKIGAENPIGIIYKNVAISKDMLLQDIVYQFVYNGANFELISAATAWANPQKVYVDLGNDNTENSTIQGGKPNAAEIISINGVLGIAHGGTGSNTQTANRLIGTDSNAALVSTGHYADNVHIGINSTNTPTANLEVTGTVNIKPLETDDQAIDKYFTVGHMGIRYLSIGANGIQSYEIPVLNGSEVPGELLIQPVGGVLRIGNINNVNVTANLYGAFNFITSNGLNFSGIETLNTNAYTPLWFSVAALDNLGRPANGIGTPQYNMNLTYNPFTNYLAIDNGGITTTSGALTVTAADNLILAAGTGHDIIYSNNENVLGKITSDGVFVIGTPETIPANVNLLVDGSAKITENLYVEGNIIPQPATGEQVTLGPIDRITFSENTATFGDAYTPVYWNNGAPAAVSVVQKQTFTIPSGATSVTLSNSAYDTNTIVLQIVITENGTSLRGPIETNSATGSLTLTSTTATGDAAVSGYVITARGVELTNQGGGS